MGFRSLRYVLAIACTCKLVISYSQNEVFKFNHLDIPLNSNRVECITQDSEGYIWVGTLAGLHKYDGINLTEYLYGEDSLSLNGSRVYDVLEDRENRLWIGTENGIYQYNRDFDNFTRFDFEPVESRLNNVNDYIYDINEDTNSRIWTSGSVSGLQYYDSEAGQFISAVQEWNKDVLLTAEVTDIVNGIDGTLWLSLRNNGVWRLNLENETILPFEGETALISLIEGADVHRMLLDSQNRLWIIIYDNGVVLADVNNPNFRLINHFRNRPNDPSSLTNNRVDHMIEDSRGRIWVANQNGGLHLFDSESSNFTRFHPNPEKSFSITSMSVRYLMEDAQQRIWVGSHLAGIDIYDKQLNKFDLYEHSANGNSISNQVVTDFYEDDKGELWISTDGGGLNHLDENGRFSAFQKNDLKNGSISSNAALTMTTDSNDNLWVGTWQGGINIFDWENQKFIQPYHNLNLHDVYSLYKDSKDNMWVGIYRNGISIFNPQGELIQQFHGSAGNEQSISGNNVLHFLEDSKGNLWIATEFNGLNKTKISEISDRRFKQFVHDSEDSTSLPSNTVNYVLESTTGEVWLATEGGLARYMPENNSFRNFSTENGFNSGSIRSIAEDGKGNLWMGTSKGLTRFNPTSYEVKNFSKEDGIQRSEFNKRSIRKLSNGKIAIGGYAGFNVFHPDSLNPNSNVPIPKIIGLSIFNEAVEIGPDSPLKKAIGEMDAIELNHKQSVISIEYVGIGFTQPERSQYAFIMEGFEDDWQMVGTRRLATYTNLDPGTYTFKVKAANSDGVWAKDMAEIAIVIIPPWWQTVFFYIIVVILVAVSIVLFIWYRTVSLLRNKQELQALVKERTTDLEKTVETLKDTESQLVLSEKMASLGVFTAGIAHEINNPINFISGSTQKLFDMLDKRLMALEDDDEELKKEQEIFKKLKEITDKGIKRTTQIINSLRNYTYNESEVFEKNDLVEICEDSLTIISHQLKSKNIELIREYDEQVFCECIPGKIGQVLINLVGNAIDAIDESGQIIIAMKTFDEYVQITVSDSGIGIAEEDIQRLFDPFYTTKEAGKGTGLGLYISYLIIQEHKGKIDVKSSKQGTKVLLQLPITNRNRK